MKQSFKFKMQCILLLNISLILVSLCSFQLVRRFSIIGVLIYISLSIFIIILSINVSFIITKTTKGILTTVVSILLSVFIISSQLSEKIALKLEFKTYKSELDQYLTHTVKTGNIRIFDDYIGIIWDPGFLDSYSVIVYDKNNTLDILYYSSEASCGNKEQYDAFQKAFKYEKIVNVIKIEDNYFRCNIHE